MNIPKSFKVGVRRKIPYLSNFFLILAGISFLVILVFDLILAPFGSAGQEMQAAVFYWLVPDFWRKLVVFSGIGFFLSVILYSFLRYQKPAILSFEDDTILIRGGSVKLTIPINSIRKVYCNDATTYDGRPKQKLSITIEEIRKNRATTLTLKEYNQSDFFMEQLIKYQGLDLQFSDFSHLPAHMEES